MNKKITTGIFAHIDAGKTTLTEQLLLLGGRVREVGSVDDGTTSTDFLSVERRRGISVRDAAAKISYRGATVNLIDTPGHADFFEETQLALSAVDMAILVLSAVEGVQAQTRLLLSAMKKKNLPVLLFLNKIDRAGAKPSSALAEIKKLTGKEPLLCNKENGEEDEDFFLENAVTALGEETLLEEYLSGTLSKEKISAGLTEKCSSGEVLPVVFGSAKLGHGCRLLADILTEYFSFDHAENNPFSAFVYQVEHRKTLGKVAHVRVFSGTIGVREEAFNTRTESKLKISQIKLIQGEKYQDVSRLCAGDVGALVGLADVKAGDILGERQNLLPVQMTSPYLRMKISPSKAEELPAVKAALEQLTDELPSLALEWIPEKRELNINASGNVQAEVLKEVIADRFGLNVITAPPSVLYKETPKQEGWGFECYTMPKPCWAVVRFFIQPLPRGSGLVYESVCSEKKIAYRYQEHVKTAVERALKQGLHGWEVTDLKVTLVDGEDHPQHTHPLDFFTATPMGIMDGLRNCGTQLLQPLLAVCITAPEECFGKIVGEISLRHAEFTSPDVQDGSFTLNASLPASHALDLGERVAILSGGRASYSATLAGFFPCPEGEGEERERVGVNPLDRAKWILHCRNAL